MRGSLDVFTAPASLEIVQSVNLTSHLERIAIDRIVPALDVDRAGPAGKAQLGDDVSPVAVAEARRAHEDELLLAENAVLLDDLPADRRVLAMDVKNLFRPFADLRQRLDQIDHLMARLPFQAEIVVRGLVEHQLPGVGIVGDVPVAGRPVAVHGAIFEGDLDALVGSALGKLAPDLLVARQAVGERLVADAAGEAGNAGGAEMMGVVDAILPALQRLQVHLALFERIAEHAEGRDGDVAIADCVAAALAEIRKVLTIGSLPEEGLEALEAEIGDLGDVPGGVLVRRPDHRADADGLCRISHDLTVLVLKYRCAGRSWRSRWRLKPWRGCEYCLRLRSRAPCPS
ncbi:hypothetical protein RHSP_80781 [Rhizobium freirei PRF 81]|uniref:Uncharacterized protein n=1 Tax=Rhizobium freirei PRF 81 TaxID=363754 RepID=N6VFD9_9HYPH|nr:hypothetical protein RHSP_80781 [Rhizobium freirei PRF 81]